MPRGTPVAVNYSGRCWAAVRYARTCGQPAFGPGYMNDAALIPQGKKVFADRCARCHSSKLPQKAFDTFFKPGCIGPNYLKCWNDYWAWTKLPEFQIAMEAEVNKPDFLDDNFLSTEVRVPMTFPRPSRLNPSVKASPSEPVRSSQRTTR